MTRLNPKPVTSPVCDQWVNLAMSDFPTITTTKPAAEILPGDIVVVDDYCGRRTHRVRAVTWMVQIAYDEYDISDGWHKPLRKMTDLVEVETERV